MKKITDYTPSNNNPNKGTQKGAGVLDESVRELGAGRSILVDKNNEIMAGTHAHEAFVNAGLEDVIEVEVDGNQIVVVKRTDMEADSLAGRKMAIADNRASEVGLDWDLLVLEELMNDVMEEGEIGKLLDDLAAEVNLDIFGGSVGSDTEPEIDRAEELRIKWGVELGQMWQLGEHRIICGDCTDKGVVDRLMGGEKADMIFTDPPYGVAYVGKTKDALTIENDNVNESTLKEMCSRWFDMCEHVCRNGAYWLATVPTGPLHEIFLSDWKRRGILRQIMVWVKDSMVLGHSEYHYRHEPILFGWIPGGERLKNSDRTKTTVWEFDRPKASREHPTMKPIMLLEYGIKQHSLELDTIYEPFSGSGTTIIACENLHRKCRAIEISPAYVAVAIERWAKHTGQEPVLIA